MQVRNSSWEIPITTASVIAKRVKEDLVGSNAAQASQESLLAEVMRTVLWAQCAHRQDVPLSEASIKTQKVLKMARAIWRPLATSHQNSAASNGVQGNDNPGEHIELEREILENLAEQGDLFELSGGRWLPAPLRLVPIAPIHHLLVGGMPTRLLPSVLLRALSFHGSLRYAESSINSSLLPDTQIPIRWQSLESWLGPAQVLEELVRYFDEQELLTVSHQHVTDTSLEAYDTNINGSQYSRWQSLDRVKDGRYLLRSSTPWGIHRYTGGSISNRRLTQQGAELRQTDIRRLCYALDKRAGKPTTARWNQQRDLLILHSELPGRERKFLSTIGTLIENADGNYYPRQWLITRDVAPIFSQLNELGIQIESDN